MTCDELDQSLYPYLDGELGTSERVRLEAHFAQCEPCTGRRDSEAKFHAALKRSLVASPGAFAPASLRANLKAGFLEETRRERLGTFARWSAVAVVAATVGAGYLHARPNARERLLEDAAIRHARRLPVEISSMPNEAVEAWFDGKLNYRVAVPRFSHATLAGARLSNVTDREAAYIAYDARPVGSTQARRVSVFIIDDRDDALGGGTWQDVEMQEVHGYRVAIWHTGEIAYELVSDLDEASVRDLFRPEPPRPAPTLVRPVLRVVPVSLQR